MLSNTDKTAITAVSLTFCMPAITVVIVLVAVTWSGKNIAYSMSKKLRKNMNNT